MPVLHFELQAGNVYDLFLRYKFQTETINHYLITVKKHWWQTISFKIILFIFLSAFTFLLGFHSYQRKQKKKSLNQQREKESILLQLKAIRSQLNPHFIFNSLTSIQSLINTNKIASANEYLSEFSSLMRDALEGGDKIFQSLDKEINILKNYLKLEQLRFDFEYRITTDNIKINEIEIPSLLLQPLVENAVKHGVSELREKGKIEITFYSDNNNLVAEIKDNGKGFNSNETTDGYGWKLTNDKIRLTNGILNEQTIEKNIFRTNDQTTVQIIFKNWI